MEGSLLALYGMHEEMTYVNHLGEHINFGSAGMYVNANDLHDYKWSVGSVNGRISSFERGLQTRKLPVRIACASKADGIIKRNRLFEVPEKDVLAGQSGRLYVNGYYCECFVTESKKSNYNISEQYMATELTITTDRPAWYRETKVEIKKDAEWKPTAETGLDTPFDTPFDLSPWYPRSYVHRNDGFTDTDFRMTIYGLVNNPSVTVNGHEYLVNAAVGSGKALTIDSVNQTVQITDVDGKNPENAFNARSRDSYIFEKIPAGQLNVMWDNSFDIDLYLIESRSEPKWMMEGL